MGYLNMLVGRLKIEALSTTISPRIINMLKILINR